MDEPEYRVLWMQAGQAFTPGSPVSERDLFAGRLDQISRIVEAISQRGFHAILYGERGVGKTSLANVLSEFLSESGGPHFFLVRANCDAADDFSSLWRKVLTEIVVSETKEGIGYGAQRQELHRRLVDGLPAELRPGDILRTLASLGEAGTLVVVIDEFDRLTDRTVPALIADTIKALSDSATHATVILIGVADSVDQLIEEHRSIERSFVQVHMPRMSYRETEEIIKKGAERLGMEFDKQATKEIANLSQGLPYVAHTIGLYSARAALDKKSIRVKKEFVDEGIRKSLEQWQQSIVTAYYNATKSPQPGHLYKEVLLACALADVDEKNFFTAAAVRAPLQVVARPGLDIPNFARHLKQFSEARRGNILVREGDERRLRYRFVSPLMRPYVVMRGVDEGLLTDEMRASISSSGSLPLS